MSDMRIGAYVIPFCFDRDFYKYNNTFEAVKSVPMPVFKKVKKFTKKEP